MKIQQLRVVQNPRTDARYGLVVDMIDYYLENHYYELPLHDSVPGTIFDMARMIISPKFCNRLVEISQQTKYIRVDKFIEYLKRIGFFEQIKPIGFNDILTDLNSRDSKNKEKYLLLLEAYNYTTKLMQPGALSHSNPQLSA